MEDPNNNEYTHKYIIEVAKIRVTTDLETDDGLEEASSVVGPGERRVPEHLLSDLAVELGGGVGHMALNVDEVLHLVKLAVHLDDRDLLTVEGIRSVVHLYSCVQNQHGELHNAYYSGGCDAYCGG